MRFTFALLALTGVASASVVIRQDSLPTCAAPCLIKADFGDCGQTDNACLCKSQPFIQSTTTCIQSSCTGDDLTAAEAYSQAICKSVGVTLTQSSTASGASSTAAGASSTAPAASSTSSKPASSTSSSSSSSASPSSTGAALSNSANVLTGAAALGLGMFALAL